MSGSNLSSKDDKPLALSPQSEGIRKMHKGNPPDFSDPNSLVTFIIVEGDGDGTKKTETKFTVHKEVACYHSPVFNAAFNSDFIEGQTQTYRLEDTTTRAFKLLVQWLYSQKVQIRQLDNDCVYDSMIFTPETLALVELWVLADRISIAKLQNHALGLIYQLPRRHNRISTYPLGYIYTHTSSGSLLRKYIVSIFAVGFPSTWFTACSNEFPKEMLVDMVIYHAEQRRGHGSVDLSKFLIPIDQNAK